MGSTIKWTAAMQRCRMCEEEKRESTREREMTMKREEEEEGD